MSTPLPCIEALVRMTTEFQVHLVLSSYNQLTNQLKVLELGQIDFHHEQDRWIY